jgi:ethanolamine ammonia-lyase small subunit
MSDTPDPAAELPPSPGTAPTRAAVTADPWAPLRRHTPARVGLGRVGASLPTRELLAFGAAHAQARDAVHLPLDIKPLLAQIGALGLPTLPVHSAAPDRATYLLRPDLGRRLSAESAATLDQFAASQTEPPDLLLVIADGLSSAAIHQQALPLLAQILRQQPAGWRLGPVVVATQARVALGDEIGQRLRAGQVAMLIGERPGLSSPDSLGIYLTHAPRVGRSDAERNCLSNVRAAGLSHAEAARKLWWLVQAARRLQLTGVGLKDRSDLVQLDALPPEAELPAVGG